MQKGRKFSELITYFRQLAEQHVAIRHSNTEKHFFRLELDELHTGLNKACYPVLILEGYQFNLGDANSDNPTKRRQSAFILASHVKDPGNFDAIHQVWDTLEEIGDDILARIKHDKRLPDNPVRHFDLSSVEVTLMKTDGNLYGMRFTFELEAYFPTDISPDRWIIPAQLPTTP
ncbi:MAG: hypothetical protein EOM73_10655 [Bacteroidia bacterium]|nr:hypothetical protein [Bacteroidia bacterium]